MAELLADVKDIQTFLGEDKLQVTDGNSDTQQVEAQRLIISQLSGVFTPTILVSWTSPTTTPGIIRSIAGRLVAAYLYRNRYYEEGDGDVRYAQMLYNEAIAMLAEIRAGTLVVVDVDDNPISVSGLEMSSDDFWPNDTTPGPFFTMTKVFS